MKDNKYFKAVEEVLQTKADEKAGYPPKCNDGYVAKDGKCVPVEGDTEANILNPERYLKDGGLVCPKGQTWDKEAKKCIPENEEK